MNKQNYNSKTKVCGTCKFFVGNRDLTNNKEYVIIAPDVEGKCFGKYQGKLRKAGDRIPACWVRWELLNEDNKSEALQELQNIIKNIKK